MVGLVLEFQHKLAKLAAKDGLQGAERRVRGVKRPKFGRNSYQRAAPSPPPAAPAARTVSETLQEESTSLFIPYATLFRPVKSTPKSL